MITVIKKIEIAFWDIVVDQLSRSQQLRLMLTELYQFKRSQEWKKMAGIMLAGGSFGFLLGFALPQLLWILR